jgi:hypothetical protein
LGRHTLHSTDHACSRLFPHAASFREASLLRSLVTQGPSSRQAQRLLGQSTNQQTNGKEKWAGGERCLTRDRPSGHVTHNALTTRMHPPPPPRRKTPTNPSKTTKNGPKAVFH